MQPAWYVSSVSNLQGQYGRFVQQKNGNASATQMLDDGEISYDRGCKTKAQFIQEQKFRSSSGARAIANICCSPPLSVPAI